MRRVWECGTLGWWGQREPRLLPPGALGVLGVQGAFWVAPRTVSSISGGSGSRAAGRRSGSRSAQAAVSARRGTPCCEGRGPRLTRREAAAPAGSLKDLVGWFWSLGTYPAVYPSCASCQWFLKLSFRQRIFGRHSHPKHGPILFTLLEDTESSPSLWNDSLLILLMALSRLPLC